MVFRSCRRIELFSLDLSTFSHVSSISVAEDLMISLVIRLAQFRPVRVCRHLSRVRFLFRDEAFEFLRCEGCGQIVRLPLLPAVSP